MNINKNNNKYMIKNEQFDTPNANPTIIGYKYSDGSNMLSVIDTNFQLTHYDFPTPVARSFNKYMFSLLTQQARRTKDHLFIHTYGVCTNNILLLASSLKKYHIVYNVATLKQRKTCTLYLENKSGLVHVIPQCCGEVGNQFKHFKIPFGKIF